MSREYGYQSQAQEPLAWERVEWRQGDGRYVFEVARGGLHATLSSPHGTQLTLPMVAWEGLLDALAAARKTKARAERNLPSRTGARWSQVETQELAKTFKAGGSVAQLARVHNRTQFAVEAQLERQGLWDRVERRPTARGIGGDAPATAATNAFRPSAAAPAAGRRHDPGQHLHSVRRTRQRPPATAPAADRRQSQGQMRGAGQTLDSASGETTAAAGTSAEIPFGEAGD